MLIRCKCNACQEGNYCLSLDTSYLGGVVVSVLATVPKGRRFKPSRGDGFVRAIEIRSTPFFGWEVKLEGPYSKILRRVKIC
jgi:hypothetical protein